MKFNVPQTRTTDRSYDDFFRDHIDSETKEVVSPPIIASTADRHQIVAKAVPKVREAGAELDSIPGSHVAGVSIRLLVKQWD